MKKSVKDQTARAFQTGGYNPPVTPQPAQPYNQPTPVNPQTGTYTLPGTGIAGYQVPTGTPTGFTSYGGATPYFQPVQFTGAQYQDPLQVTNLPTFADTVGNRPGQYDELRTYINDAGQTLQIPFKDGRPIYPIPEGYRPIGDEPAPEEEQQTTVDPVVGETTVRDEGGGDGAMADSTISTTASSILGKSSFGSVSEANQAVSNAYGVFGNRGINVGAIAGILGQPLAAIASVSGVGPSTMAFGTSPPPGTFGFTQETLSEIAMGKGSPHVGITAAQAQNRMDAASVLGLQDISGYTGFQPGDAVPGIPGAFMDSNGIARDVKTGSVAVGPNGQRAYSSIKSMVARLSMTQEEKNKEDSKANMEAVSAEMGRQSRSAAARNRARDAEAGRESDDRSGSKGAEEAKSGGSLADSGTSGKGYSGSGSSFQGPHGTGPSPDSGPSGPSTGDTGTGTPGEPGMGGAAPGGAPDGSGMGGGGLDGQDGGSTEGSGSVGDG